MKEKNERKKKNRKKIWERNGLKSRMRSVAGAISLTMVLLVTVLCIFAQPGMAAQISVEPAYQEVSMGENFTVDIYVDPEGDVVYGAQYKLYFNNSLLNATDQTQGPFLTQDGNPTDVWSNTINNISGYVMYCEIQKYGGVGVTTPGVLTTITFQAIAEEEGVSELSFDLAMTKLTRPDSSVYYPNTNNGNVSIRAGICGDVDDDGYILTNDGDAIYNVAGGMIDPGDLANEWAADVDCDGYILTNDGDAAYNVAGGIIDASDLNCC